MRKYPKHLRDLTEKELEELNFTALLFLHSKVDRLKNVLNIFQSSQDLIITVRTTIQLGISGITSRRLTD